MINQMETTKSSSLTDKTNRSIMVTTAIRDTGLMSDIGDNMYRTIKIGDQ